MTSTEAEIAADAPKLPSNALGNFTIAYVTSEAEAHVLIDEIVADASGGLIGVDCETAPKPVEKDYMRQMRDAAANCGGKLAALTRAKADRAAIVAQKEEVRKAKAVLDYACRAGLDPHRADIRLVQLYGGGRRVAVIDLFRTGPAILRRLNDLRLVFHNAAFELSFLAMHGVEPAEVHCTQQACRLTLGPRSTSLASAAANYLGVELAKDLQASDWAAEHLTNEQVRYAAQDAIACWRIAQQVLPALREQTSAYEIQMTALPAAVRMQLRGFGFNAEAHAVLMDELRRERVEVVGKYAAACAQCDHPALAAASVPATPKQKAALLETLLSSEELAAWKRTDRAGDLSTKRSELKRAAHYPPIAALVEISSIDKMLTAFDTGLSSLVSPVTGRIHAHYRIAGASSGRATCSGPNLQQVPRDARFRALFEPAPGNVLIVADYASMELRAAAHISGDPVMTAVFERGDDLHTQTAAAMTGRPLEEVTAEERKAAKPVNFGAIYGQGPTGLVASAWENFGLVMTETEARSQLRTFERTYPTFVHWRREHADKCAERRLIVIGRDAVRGIGRFYQKTWLHPDKSFYTRSCNLPVQGACADAAMLALANIDRLLFEEGIEGGPAAWLHDEIVIEVPEADARRASDLLAHAMIDAFAETFPGAPINDIVAPKAGRDWNSAKD